MITVIAERPAHDIEQEVNITGRFPAIVKQTVRLIVPIFRKQRRVNQGAEFGIASAESSFSTSIPNVSIIAESSATWSVAYRSIRSMSRDQSASRAFMQSNLVLSIGSKPDSNSTCVRVQESGIMSVF